MCKCRHPFRLPQHIPGCAHGGNVGALEARRSKDQPNPHTPSKLPQSMVWVWQGAWAKRQRPNAEATRLVTHQVVRGGC